MDTESEQFVREFRAVRGEVPSGPELPAIGGNHLAFISVPNI